MALTKLAAVLLLALPASAAPKRASAAKTREARLEPAKLRTEVPAAWGLTQDGAVAGSLTPALTALGPEGKDGVRTRIGLRWYGPGNRYFKDSAAYLARQADAGPIPVAGEKTGPVEDASLMGKPAKRLKRETFETIPPQSHEGRSVPVKEELLVADYDGGFLVLELRASAADFDKARPAFERAAAALSPAKPRGP
ncbi:MAG: hypothetical protein HY928_11195 [Elusimicrobia bacterium]|nr:hypothetical protein [Elusimicrobiota bacterium]